MRSSGTWLVIGMVGIAALFAALTWRRYSAENPTSANGVLRQNAEGWMAEVTFDPAMAEKIPVGARAVLTTPDHPDDVMGGTVEESDPAGRTRITVTQTVPTIREGPVRATIDAEVAPAAP